MASGASHNALGSLFNDVVGNVATALGRVIMSVLGDVFGSLRTMTQLQLLLAFVACIGYAFAQGRLLPWKGRRVAWCAAAVAATGFAFESSDWTHAAMLLGFALAGMGSFVASVWLISRLLGFGAARGGQPVAALALGLEAEAAFVAGPIGARSRHTRPAEPAHSL